MKLRESIALGMAGATLVACSTGAKKHEPHPESPMPTKPASGLVFDRQPATNFAVAQCQKDPQSWAVLYDMDPSASSAFGTQTLGVREFNKPKFFSGVTIRALGHATYELATSDDRPGRSTVVDINKGPYVVVIKGNQNFDEAFSARFDAGNPNGPKVDFWLTCLPNFGFSGDKTPVPLDSVPQEPQPPSAVHGADVAIRFSS